MIPSSTYEEVVGQFSKEVKEILCYQEDGRLLISKTHRWKPEVSSIIARLKRLSMPHQIQYVDLSVISQMQEALAQNKDAVGKTDMQRASMQLFEKACTMRASDIHIRVSTLKNTSVHFRVHGDLELVEEHPSDWGAQLCTTIYQSMADVSDATFETMNRQDARIASRKSIPSGVDGIRIATTPQVDGFVMVLRLLYNDTVESFDLGLLGYLDRQQSAIELMKRRPTGVNIIAGPTGSGKSTTLQRTLGALIKESHGRKHVITVEDPPEYPIPGAVQTPVTNAETEEDRSRAFQSAIKACMRLDPDVIMIGEIRDTPSARLAIQASMTGHQVWTTLHANGAFAIIDRLLDLGVTIESLSDHSIITGLICQRLVKVLCPHCKVKLIETMERYTETQRRRVAAVVEDIERVYVTGNGCAHCWNTGSNGRTVVAETITTDPRLMSFIRARDRIGAMSYWKNEQGGKTMLGHAIELVVRGEIDPFAAEDIVGPLNMEEIESDNRIDQHELTSSFAKEPNRGH